MIALPLRLDNNLFFPKGVADRNLLQPLPLLRSTYSVRSQSLFVSSITHCNLANLADKHVVSLIPICAVLSSYHIHHSAIGF